MTMRLSLRMERATLRWGTALSALILAGMAVTAVGMMSVVGRLSCDADFTSRSCAALIYRFAPWQQAGSLLVGSMWVLPVLLGAIFGVAITAAELERRTAHVSWSLSTDRRRWLLFRALPAGVFLGVVLGAGALGAELVTRTRLITDDAGFIDYQLRTALVPLRGLLAFAIAIAVGAQLGRVLPALLIAIVVAAAATAGLGILVDAWHLGSAQFVSLARLLPDQYPLIVRPGETQWPQGQGVMQIPISDFGKWLGIEAAAYFSVTAGIAIVADGIIAKRSPR
jgi:hypothetical protein